MFLYRRGVETALDIPVMHDDQHGTAIAVLAALMNAAKVVKKDFKKLKVVILGAGAAGTAVAKLLLKAGVRSCYFRQQGHCASHRARTSRITKKHLRTHTSRRHGLCGEIAARASGRRRAYRCFWPQFVSASTHKAHGKASIVFAMANPTPEISPEEAKRGGAVVIGNRAAATTQTK